MVPVSINDETIKMAASFRQGGRFPVLSYRHTNGVSLYSLVRVEPTVGRSRVGKVLAMFEVGRF